MVMFMYWSDVLYMSMQIVPPWRVVDFLTGVSVKGVERGYL